MKKIITVILLAVVGVGLLSYPHVSAYLFEKNSQTVIQEYTDIVKENPEDMQLEWERAVDYNNQLSGEDIKDPFIENSGMVLNDDYLERLNINGVMGHVSIPKINVNLPIRHGTDEATLTIGTGHLQDTALPVGGMGTHCVITGHTGLANAKMFTDLTQMEKGDVFFIYVLDKILAYEVDQITVIEPENTNDLLPVSNEDYVTLITCTPYGINSHRLLVRGTRVEYTPELESEAQNMDMGMSEETKVLIITAVIATLITIFILLLISKLQKRRLQNNTVDEEDIV